MEAAPLFTDVKPGPESGRAVWLRARDGVRIRLGLWPKEGAKGTVLMFPGRSEYVEKYAPAAADFAARGYASLAIDWRGQGLADRLLADPNIGHVGRFSDYQLDLAAVVAAAGAAGLPRPWHLVAHSMGGAIGLRALIEGLPVRRAVFSAPMWGLKFAAATRPVAWAVATFGTSLGLGHLYAPSTGPATYVAIAPFADNVLTTDPEMFAMMRDQVRNHPELGLGGPSITWLHEALHECRALEAHSSPAVPALTFLGGNERVVASLPIEARMARWPGGELRRVPGAEHEIIMETPTRRSDFFDRATAWFEG